MTLQVKIYLAIVAILGVALFGIYEHHTGVVTGQIEQKVSVDKQSLTTAHKTTVEATVNAEKFNQRVDDAHTRTETARAALVPIREKVAITPKGVTVGGDSSPAIVIPALVDVIHYQDTLQIRSDSELHAQQFRHVADSVMAGAAREEARAAVKFATDQATISAPRCSVKCGVLIGVGSVVLVLAGLHQIGFHF